MRQNECLFCSSVHLSGEHLWPDWICKLYPAGKYLHSTHNANEWKHEKVKNSITHKFTCICTTCNNGWMSEIEKLAIPVIRPMIQGRFPKQIGRHQQYAIALWLSLRSIVFDAYSATKSEEEFFTRESRHSFAQSKRTPLANTRIWLGRMAADWQGASYSVKGGAHTLTKDIGVNIATCVVGEVAFQIFTCRAEWWSLLTNRSDINLDPEHVSSEAWREFIVQIWPRRLDPKLPPLGLSDDQFQLLNVRFGGTLD